MAYSARRPLSDYRLQLFIRKIDITAWSEWKTDASNPNLSWSGWSPFSSDQFLGVDVFAPLSDFNPYCSGSRGRPCR